MASADSDASNVQKVVNRSPLLLQSRRPRSPALGVGGRNDGPAAPDPAGGRNRLPDHDRDRYPVRGCVESGIAVA